MKIKNYPEKERPREKAYYYGIDSLTNNELLALILRTGSKKESALQLAQRVINEVGGLSYLKDVTYHQLVSINGIKKAKAISILAVIELTKRIKGIQKEQTVIKEPKDGYYLVKDKLMFEQQEHVIILCLNSKLEVMKEKTVFIGSNNISIISGREIFKEALICGSSRIMVIHNHPSGNPKPSFEDIEITKRLYLMAEELEIEIVDHLIIGRNKFYSFASKEIIEV